MLPDLSDIDPRHLKIRLTDAARGGRAEAVKIFCPCGHVGTASIADLITKYGPEVTFNHIERLARCGACGGRRDLDARPAYTATMGTGDKAYST